MQVWISRELMFVDQRGSVVRVPFLHRQGSSFHPDISGLNSHVPEVEPTPRSSIKKQSNSNYWQLSSTYIYIYMYVIVKWRNPPYQSDMSHEWHECIENGFTMFLLQNFTLHSTGLRPEVENVSWKDWQAVGPRQCCRGGSLGVPDITLQGRRLKHVGCVPAQDVLKLDQGCHPHWFLQ